MSLNQLTASFTSYLERDEGAVTVDFVVLTSMICLFGIGVAVAINSATAETAAEVANTIDTMSVWTYN